jgi:hypothetical protein
MAKLWISIIISDKAENLLPYDRHMGCLLHHSELVIRTCEAITSVNMGLVCSVLESGSAYLMMEA